MYWPCDLPYRYQSPHLLLSKKANNIFLKTLNSFSTQTQDPDLLILLSQWKQNVDSTAFSLVFSKLSHSSGTGRSQNPLLRCSLVYWCLKTQSRSSSWCSFSSGRIAWKTLVRGKGQSMQSKWSSIEVGTQLLVWPSTGHIWQMFYSYVNFRLFISLFSNMLSGAQYVQYVNQSLSLSMPGCKDKT